jgi:hypothetical protein
MTKLPSVDGKSNPDRAAGKPKPARLRKLHLLLHRRFPGFVRHPNYNADLAAWRRKDTEENEKTTPPPEEHIDLCCVWALEFYTPAHIQSLLDGLTSLGWGDSLSASPDRNPVDWIQRLREDS